MLGLLHICVLLVTLGWVQQGPVLQWQQDWTMQRTSASLNVSLSVHVDQQQWTHHQQDTVEQMLMSLTLTRVRHSLILNICFLLNMYRVHKNLLDSTEGPWFSINTWLLIALFMISHKLWTQQITTRNKLPESPKTEIGFKQKFWHVACVLHCRFQISLWQCFGERFAGVFFFNFFSVCHCVSEQCIEKRAL